MEKEINKLNEIYTFLIIIVLIIIIGVIGTIFFEPKSLKKTELDILAPEYIFVGETKEIDVKTNDSPVAVICKNGYLQSNQISFEGTEFKIPLIALKPGNEEIELKTNNTSKKTIILVCDKLKTKNQDINLVIGESKKLEFNLSDECLSKYSFFVEDSNVATYNNGIIEGLKVGNTKINIQRESEIYTYNIKIEPKELKFANSVSKLDVGDSYTLKVVNADNSLKCTSSDNEIITVKTSSDSCVLKTLKQGKATITASANNKKVKITVAVEQPVEKINFTSSEYSVQQGSSVNAAVTIIPSDATNKSIKCTSSDIKIVTVSDSGTKCVVKGVKIGIANITATIDGKSTTASVTVTDPVSIVNLKVATWNLGRYGKTSQSSAVEQANYFKLQNIDIAGFQEVKPYSDPMTVPLDTYVSITGLGHYRYHETPAGNAVLSRYKIISARNQSLTSCHESRGLTKVVIQVNGIDISFYTTHFSHQERCRPIHAKSLAELVKNDPNPQIITGDFNIKKNEILTPELGSEYKIVAYDKIEHYYTDSIIIKAKDSAGKERIRLKNFDALKTNGIYTDHNMVVANLEILN